MSRFILFMSLFLFAGLSAEANVDPGYKVGDKAADFKLKNVDGKMVSLADYKDAKGFIIIFTCNHCPFSIAYEDRIIDLHRKYAPKGYYVIAINPNDPTVQPDDSFDAMKTRASEKGFSFPYLMDEGQKIYPQYGATRTPHVFILDKQRVVQYIGAIDDNHSDAAAVTKPYIEQAVDALLVGRTPAETFTRAVGCTIKAKK